jgi:hypothetical protein
MCMTAKFEHFVCCFCVDEFQIANTIGVFGYSWLFVSLESLSFDIFYKIYIWIETGNFVTTKLSCGSVYSCTFGQVICIYKSFLVTRHAR